MTEHNTDTDTATDSAQLAALEDRISSLESQLNDDGSFDPRAWLAQLPQATRRQVITAALSAVGIGAATQAAMAQTTQKNIACQWLGNQDAQGYNLTGLGTLEFADGTSMSSAATGGGALSDSGSDNTDGGDQYNLPQAEDSIDLQLSGDIENAASVTTDSVGLKDSDGDQIIHEAAYIAEDSDTSTVLDEDTGALGTTHDSYIVTCLVEGQASGGSDGKVQIRVNGDSTENYEWNKIFTGSLGTRSGNTEWWCQQWDQFSTLWKWKIGHGNPVSGPTTNNEAQIKTLLGGQMNKEWIINGDLSKDIGDVNRIRVFTDFNATGYLHVRGVRRSL